MYLWEGREGGREGGKQAGTILQCPKVMCQVSPIQVTKKKKCGGGI